MRRELASTIWTRLRTPSVLYYLLVAVHLAVGCVFITKYGVRYGLNPIAVSAVFIAVGLSLMYMLRRRSVPAWAAERRTIILITIVLTVALLIFMRHFDPLLIRNARHIRLDETIARLLHGEYPTPGPMTMSHSALPMWFILSIPFYLIGDSGLFLLLTLPVLAWVLWRINPKLCLAGVLITFSAPQFLYEIATRSDLALNMTLFLGALCLSSVLLERRAGRWTALAGILTGLLLSTRAVTLIPSAAFIGYQSRRESRQTAIYFTASVATLILTIAPFALWDWDKFIRWGPVTHQLQLGRIPLVGVAVALAAVCFLGRRMRTFEDVLGLSAFVLIAIVGFSGAEVVASDGLATAVMGSAFDVSYLIIPMPYMIAAILRLAPIRSGSLNVLPAPER